MSRTWCTTSGFTEIDIIPNCTSFSQVGQRAPGVLVAEGADADFVGAGDRRPRLVLLRPPATAKSILGCGDRGASLAERGQHFDRQLFDASVTFGSLMTAPRLHMRPAWLPVSLPACL
jgi:hypothetical protein